MAAAAMDAAYQALVKAVPALAAYDPRVVLAVAAVACYLLLSALFGKRRPKNAPPVWTGGLPIIGHFSDFAANPVETMKQGYKACGSVFTMSFLGNEMTFLVSAEAQVPFYRANDEELSQNEPYKFMTPIFGKGIVFDAPLHIKNQQLKFVSGALRPQALKTYVPQIIAETEEFLKGWGDSGEVDLLDAMSRLIILTASRCLLGREVREHLFEEVASLLHDIDEGLNPLAIFFPNAPLPMFRKRDRARAELQRVFSKVIAARRAAQAEGKAAESDMLQAFMEAQYKDGSKCDDYQITGLLLATLFAGQHTSSITSTWTLLNLVNSPSHYARAMAENAAAFGTAPADASKLSFDSISQLNFLHNCVKESLRQYPPLIMLMRKVHEPLQVGAYTVPKGHLVFASPSVSMNLPNDAADCHFPNPETFDPDRYAEGREEDKKTAFAFSAFGGGRHGCLGEQFGYMQVKTIVSLLLREFEITPVNPLPAPNYRAMVVGPTQPARIRYRRRKAPLAEPFTIPKL